MGASVVLGRMEQTGLWGQAGDGPNKSMGQTTHGANRPIGRPDERAIGCMGHGAFPCDKTWERISGISLWDSTSIRRSAQFPRFCVTMGKLVCALLMVAFCGLFHMERNSSWECT